MKNTRFISIFLITALIVSVFSFSANAGFVPSLSNASVQVTGPRTAIMSVSVNPNGSPTTVHFKYWTASRYRSAVYNGVSGSSSVYVEQSIFNLFEGTTYSYQITAVNSSGTNPGIQGTFTTPSGSGSSTGGTTSGSGSTSGSTSGTSGSQVLGTTSGSGTNGTAGSGSGSSGSGTSNTTTNGTTGTKANTTATLSRTPVASSNPMEDRPSYISLEYSLGNSGALVLVADNIKPKPGEEFSYTVVYKNETNFTFNEANLKVILPSEVDYIGSDQKPNDISGNIVEFNIGNIAPRAQGAVVVIVEVKETVEPGTNMIFTSVLGYKDSKGTQLADTSYMTVRVGESSAPLSASIGSVVSTSSILWLIAIALMIMMGLLVFRLVRMRKNSKPRTEEDIFGLGKVPATFEPVGGGVTFKR